MFANFLRTEHLDFSFRVLVVSKQILNIVRKFREIGYLIIYEVSKVSIIGE